MSIDALVTGRLVGQPQQRTSKAGNAFTICKVRVPTGEDNMFCNVICFDQTAQAALLALGTGDAVSLAGSLKVGTWMDKNGVTRASLDMTASQVLTAYSIAKRRKAAQGNQEGGQQRQQYRRDDYAPDPGGLDDGAPLDF